MEIPVETSPEISGFDVFTDFSGVLGNFAPKSEADYCFIQAINLLSNIKLAAGGQALYGTLRKRKVLKGFVDSYLKNNVASQLDDLEERIASLK